MYKLAALTCVAIGVFAMGIMHLSDKQILSLTPTSIDFQSKSVVGTLVINSVKQRELRGNLLVSNNSNLPIKLDFSEFLITLGKLSGTMCRLPSHTRFDKSHCEPVMDLGDDHLEEMRLANVDFLLIEPGLSLDLEIKILFDQEIKSGDLEIAYPSSRIYWLTDSIT